MSLNIILDKSAFQSLSYDELLRLTYYYKHNITPVLVMEILGDLKKEEKEGNPPSQKRVIDFATKLFPTNTIINMHYLKPLKGELSGAGAVEMQGRPLVELGKGVKTDAGEMGWVVGETEEEKAIYSWREGKFSQADRDLSNIWRSATTEENLLINLKKELNEKGEKISLKSFEELDAFVTAKIDRPENQQNLLLDICRTYDLGVAVSFRILSGWIRAGRPLLKQFIPYAYHILRVNTLFHVGLQCELIGTRPTNKVDLEYLYYLPFCHVFSSNDHLHVKLAPLLLRSDQHFVKGAMLKEDLKEINNYLAAQSQEISDKYKKAPPLMEGAFTYSLYKEFFGYPDHWQWKSKSSSLSREEAIKKMKEFEKAGDGSATGMTNGDMGSFVIRKSFMSKNDPCVCGSGKKVIECCVTEDQFNQAARDQIANRNGSTN